MDISVDTPFINEPLYHGVLGIANDIFQPRTKLHQRLQGLIVRITAGKDSWRDKNQKSKNKQSRKYYG